MAAAELEHRIRPADGDPHGALVLMHGRGVNMFDLLPLADELDPERRFVAITPQAPLELTPGGWHWYVVERVGYPHAETFWHSYELLTSFVDGLEERIGVPLSRTVLGGFSQGGVMSYAAGLGAGRPHPAAVVAFSSFVPVVDGFQLADDLGGHPVAHGHGTLDPVIPVEFGRRSAELLREAGCDLLYRESPIPHTIDPAFAAEVRAWLGEVID